MNEGGRVTEMSGYFDMHCHLLYGVDDGAETMEAALELLGLQYEDGVRTVCLTPHCRRELFEWSAETVQRHFELLKERAGTVYPDLKLILGCEIHVSHDLVQQLREGRCLTLGGSGHVLLEFPEYADKKYLIDRCHEVIRSGYSPVRAHAERCTAIRKDIGLLQRLVDMGVQIQMNAGSILGEEGLARKWFCKKAMKRGLHVMVEKPAGVYTRQVREMNEEAKKHPDVVFGMMFNQRTNCLYRKLYELVHSGKYGRIRRTNWIITDWYRSQAYYDSGSWRATWSGEGGGVLLNQCPHQLDLWQWICGMPVSVEAHLHYGMWHDIEVEDDVTAYVEYENGATGVFITSTGDAHGSNRLEIQMDGAKFVVENDILLMEEYEMSEPEFSKVNKAVFDTVGSKKVYVDTDGNNLQHVGILNAWADAILYGGNLVARGEEGLNGLTLSNAMHLSAFIGKKVMLPFDEDLYYAELMKRVATSRRKTAVSAVFADTASSYNGAK